MGLLSQNTDKQEKNKFTNMRITHGTPREYPEMSKAGAGQNSGLYSIFKKEQ